MIFIKFSNISWQQVNYLNHLITLKAGLNLFLYSLHTELLIYKVLLRLQCNSNLPQLKFQYMASLDYWPELIRYHIRLLCKPRDQICIRPTLLEPRQAQRPRNPHNTFVYRKMIFQKRDRTPKIYQKHLYNTQVKHLI